MFLAGLERLHECLAPVLRAGHRLTFWEWLENEHEKGNVASIVRVREEIDDGEAGHLTTWAASLPRTFWIKPGADTFSFLEPAFNVDHGSGPSVLASGS